MKKMLKVIHLVLFFSILIQQTGGKDCVPGRYKDERAALCQPCQKGAYKYDVGPGPCTECPGNTTTVDVASDNLDDCLIKHPNPVFLDFNPKFGPKAGGTFVNITIENFKDREAGKIYIGMQLCTTARKGSCGEDIECWVGCKSPPVSEVSLEEIKINIIDPFLNFTLISPDKFEFMSNPSIDKIENLGAIMSGGIDLIVYGGSLNSVAAPMMVITRLYNDDKTLFESLCRVLSTSRMDCPVPDLSVGLDLDLKLKRKKRDNKVSISLDDGSLEFFVGFKLDGVRDFEEFSPLPVYEDPVFHHFEEENKIREFSPDEEEHLLIKGTKLNLGLSIHDVEVTIGNGNCTVIELTTNQISCIPPEINPGPGVEGIGPRNSLLVKVYAGYLVNVVGYLVYNDAIDEGGDNGTMAIILATSCSFIFILTVLWAVVMIRLRKKSYNIEKEKKYNFQAWNGDANGQLPVQNGGFSNASYRWHQNNGVNNYDLFHHLDPNMQIAVKECSISSDRIDIGYCIGSGEFGEVFVATLKIGQDLRHLKFTTVAVKAMKENKSDSISEIKRFLEEALIMKGFSHPNVLKFYGVSLRDNNPFVVLEYMDMGDLKNYLREHKHSITLTEQLAISLQIALGMSYLSSKKFVHRDLAARNCLINNTNAVKIGDFGLSRDLHSGEYYRIADLDRPLPIKWMATESINYGKFSTKSDVWSFGILLWEIYSKGCTPYQDILSFDLKDHLNQGGRPSKPLHTPDELYKIMKSCWLADANDRPSFKEISFQLKNLSKLMTNKTMKISVFNNIS